MEKITWTPKLVKLEDLKENASNPKILNELGEKRLHNSLFKFGIAGTMVANLDNIIIDGHKRKQDLLDDGVTEVWVSYPSRLLTEQEYLEMNAVYDIAKAGDPDQFMIEQILSDDLLEEWDMNGDKPKRKKGGGITNDDEIEAKYPLVPQYDEKYEAIVILCTNSIDTVFIKNALGIEKEMSYKNKMVKETSIVAAKKFIKAWSSK